MLASCRAVMRRTSHQQSRPMHLRPPYAPVANPCMTATDLQRTLRHTKGLRPPPPPPHMMPARAPVANPCTNLQRAVGHADAAASIIGWGGSLRRIFRGRRCCVGRCPQKQQHWPLEPYHRGASSNGRKSVIPNPTALEHRCRSSYITILRVSTLYRTKSLQANDDLNMDLYNGMYLSYMGSTRAGPRILWASRSLGWVIIGQAGSGAVAHFFRVSNEPGRGEPRVCTGPSPSPPPQPGGLTSPHTCSHISMHTPFSPQV